jgi:hypothetical protein
MSVKDWGRLKCNEHFIIKLRYYASEHFLKLMHSDGASSAIGRQKHMEATRDYHTFFWNFITRVTEKPDMYFHKHYFMHATECAIEEIYETHGIYISQREGHYYYFIPKKHTEIIQWVKDNVNIPCTPLKKTTVGIIKLVPDTWRREEYKTEEELFKKLDK